MNYKSFCINLKSNDFRRQHILQQQDKAGLDITVFEAIAPETLGKAGIEYDASGAKAFTGRDLMATEIACALSHMCLWKKLLHDEKTDYYLIMEDDIEIKDNIASIIAAIDVHNIDFLKFSGQCRRPMKKMHKVKDDYHLYKYAYGPLDAACYLVSKKAAQHLLNYCRDLKAPVDILMDRAYDHGIPVYGILPYPVHTAFCFDADNPLYTDIGIRNNDYKSSRNWQTKLSVRYYRLLGSFKRKLSTIKLALQ
jgi:glycosyl transferase family 25